MDLNDTKPLIDVVPRLYEDGAKPVVLETGKTLSLIPRTINAVLAPLRTWIARKEYNVAETEKLLAIKLDKVGADHIVSPEPYVAVPAIQAISYAMNSKELRNLYANLLAKSMTDTQKDRVHPAFVEIIKQITPDEAKLLKTFVNKGAYPLIDIRVITEGDGTFRTFIHNFTTIVEGICEDCNAFAKYIDNLSRLKIIEIPEDLCLAIDDAYIPLETHPEVIKTLQKPLPEGERWEIHRKQFKITAFGKEFIDICVKDN